MNAIEGRAGGMRKSDPGPARSIAWMALASAMLMGCVVAPVAPPPPPRPAPPPPVHTPQGRSPAAAPASSPMYFYPERGQGEAQQDRDRYECYRWAVRETGVDPGMTTVRQPVPVPVAGPVVRDGGEVVAGAATGAIVGAAVSSPRHAGAGAVIGAIFGATLGAASQEARAQAIEAAQARRQEAAAAAAESARVPLDNFRRAMAACMQGRGYRVG
jgi:hypothetical protein